MSGVVTQHAIPTSSSQLRGITLGPDGAFWYVENAANRVGKLDVVPNNPVMPIVANGIKTAPVEGAPFSGPVATFADPNAGRLVSDVSATVDWGDGQRTQGSIVFDSVQNDFVVNAPHSYGTAGSYPVAVMANDIWGGTATATGVASVAGAPLSLSAVGVAAFKGVRFNGVVASFTTPTREGRSKTMPRRSPGATVRRRSGL
jgi:hypothetical protein